MMRCTMYSIRKLGSNVEKGTSHFWGRVRSTVFLVSIDPDMI
jgi:hypothetical protein